MSRASRFSFLEDGLAPFFAAVHVDQTALMKRERRLLRDRLDERDRHHWLSGSESCGLETVIQRASWCRARAEWRRWWPTPYVGERSHLFGQSSSSLLYSTVSVHPSRNANRWPAKLSHGNFNRSG